MGAAQARQQVDTGDEAAAHEQSKSFSHGQWQCSNATPDLCTLCLFRCLWPKRLLDRPHR